MICKHNMYLTKLNEQRKKEGLPPLNRRQFCKLAATSSVILGMPGFLGCEQNNQSGGCGDSGGQAAGCGNSARPTEKGDGGSDYVKAVLGQDTRADIGVRPGVELDDYSGPFRPDLRYTDFSKVGLSRLIQMASEYHNAIQGRYRQFIDEVHGHAAAVSSEETIWGGSMVNSTHRLIKKTMKINGKNLESFMKQWQIELNTIPSDVSNVYFEMPTKRRGLATVNTCPVALHYEAAGRTDELREICEARCGNAVQNGAKKFDSNIVVKNLTMPPRASENHVCCKWELYYKADGSKSAEETDLLIDPDKMDQRGELVARSDVDLKDYSGAFRPDLKLTDFTREQLASMFLMYHQYDLNMIMGYSTAEIKAGGSTKGENMQVVVWSNDLAEAARSIQMKWLKTSGAGIDSFLKAVQVDITAQPPNFDNDFEMPDENTGIYTFNKCIGLNMMEPFATEEQIVDLCALDPPAIGNSCDMYSRGLTGKKIELEIVALPPRKYTDAVCCQWKFTYVAA